MRCANCGSANPSDVQFCGHCGNPVAVLLEPAASSTHSATGTDASGQEGGLPTRDLSGLLAESLRLFRSRPALFLVIGLIPQLPGLLGLAASDSVIEIALMILGLGLLPIAQGAAVHCVAGGYAGLPVSSSTCLAASAARAPALIASALILIGALSLAAALIFIMVGIPLFFMVLVFLWLYPQSIVVERNNPIVALRRSAKIVSGDWWRVFGTGVVFVAPFLAVTVIILMISANSAPGLLLGSVYALVSAALVSWVMIGSTLLYFDLRVRKEGYNLEVLASEMGTVTTA